MLFLVAAKCTFGIVGMCAWLSRVFVGLRAGPGLLAEVSGLDVGLEGVPLPEGLITWRVSCTLERFPLLMCCSVILQPLTGTECFAAAIIVAYVFSFIRMSCCEVMLEVRFTDV